MLPKVRPEGFFGIQIPLASVLPNIDGVMTLPSMNTNSATYPSKLFKCVLTPLLTLAPMSCDIPFAFNLLEVPLSPDLVSVPKAVISVPLRYRRNLCSFVELPKS